jgi:hypothetical protein
LPVLDSKSKSALAMKTRLTLVLAACLAVGALAADNLFKISDSWFQKYPRAGEPGNNPGAIFARSLVESPATNGTIQIYDDDTKAFRDLKGADLHEEHFVVTATLTSAAAATAVSLIADSRVPAGRKVYVSDYTATVNGATDWATTANVKIQDTEGTPVDFVTFTASELDGNEIHKPGTTGDALENAYKLGTGGTAAKGIRVVGNANGTGSDLVVTVQGVIR